MWYVVFEVKKKKPLTSKANLIFHSQDIIWQRTIQYILSLQRGIPLARLVAKSKIVIIEFDIDIYKIYVHTTHLTFRSQVHIRNPKL